MAQAQSFDEHSAEGIQLEAIAESIRRSLALLKRS
jgi:hypothetical protein